MRPLELLAASFDVNSAVYAAAGIGLILGIAITYVGLEFLNRQRREAIRRESERIVGEANKESASSRSRFPVTRKYAATFRNMPLTPTSVGRFWRIKIGEK